MLFCHLACSCAEPSVPPDDSSRMETEPPDSPSETAIEDSPEDTGPFPVAVATAAPQMGDPPVTIQFTAEGSTSPTGEMHGSWVIDGVTHEGLDVQVPFGEGGEYQAVLTVDDGVRTAQDEVTVYIRDADCPGVAYEVWGTVTAEQLNEISGVVQSRQDARVLWVHNDSGDDPRFFAVRDDGRLLGTYLLDGAERGDLEDIAIGQDQDGHILYVGDIGDNPGTREFIRVYRVVEPTVDVASDDPVDEVVQAETMLLRYPDGVSYNSETLFIDPRDQALYIVTKDYGGLQKLFRKNPPHAPGDYTLDYVMDLDFGQPPLNGGATTAGDISLDGSLIMVRTYAVNAWLWRRGENESVQQAMSEIPCRITMPEEPQSESVAFSTDSAGLITISEREGQPVNYTALQFD